MNKMTAIKEMTELDNAKLADATGIDIVELSLFEQGLVPIHIYAAERICDEMGVDMREMFPELAELFNAADTLDNEEEIIELFSDPPNKMALRNHGLDPDLRDWILIVDLKCGIERRYRVTSLEKEKIRNDLLSAPTADGFVCFYADCQHVLLKRSAITELTFAVEASYAKFSSKEKAFAVSLIFEDSVRPELSHFFPDGGQSGEDEKPFSRILSNALEGATLPPFFEVPVPDGNEERFVSINALEALEIPMGIIFPSIYDPASDARYVGPDTPLGRMDAVGTA